MTFKVGLAACAVASAVAAPAAAWAMGVGIGCVNLPAYQRAVGTLQGISSCDMTVDQARRIIAERDGYAVVEPPRPPVRRARPWQP